MDPYPDYVFLDGRIRIRVFCTAGSGSTTLQFRVESPLFQWSKWALLKAFRKLLTLIMYYGGGGKTFWDMSLFWPTHFFLFWIKILVICHDLGSIKHGHSFHYSSVIMVKTKASCTNFCVTWLNLPPNPNYTISVESNEKFFFYFEMWECKFMNIWNLVFCILYISAKNHMVLI